MKNKIYTTLTRPYIVIVTILIATFLSYFDRNYGYFFGLSIALLILWGSNYNWSKFGLSKKINKQTVFKSIAYAVLIYVGVDIVQSFLEIYLGEIDLSSVDHIRNDVGNYLSIMIIMWIFAAFGEEFLFTGYYMKRLAELFGDTNKAWIISAISISIYFGASHSYQGPAGMIAVGLGAFCSALIFCKNRNNLLLVVLIHGFYDTIGLTLIYFNNERLFFNWIQSIL